MSPARLKLTMTVMSIGLARDSGGGLQQLESRTKTSRMVLTCPVSPRAPHAKQPTSSAAANKNHRPDPLPTCAHFMSDATCTFSILSGLTTAPLSEPSDAFLSLSTTDMPCTTLPTTVYWPLRLGAGPYMMKNCELAESTLSPRRAMPTMPRVNGTLENSAFRSGYF